MADDSYTVYAAMDDDVNCAYSSIDFTTSTGVRFRFIPHYLNLEGLIKYNISDENTC